MKKTIPIIIGVAVLAIIGAVLILSGNRGGEKANTENKSVTEKIADKMDLLGWLKGGESVECILSTSDGEMKVSTKGKKVRIDGMPYFFGGNASEPEIGTSITDEDYVYIWSGNNGIKFKNEKTDQASDEVIAEENQGADISWEDWANGMEEAGTSYECEKKNFSDSTFELPEDVEFIDWSETLDQLENFNTEISSSTDENGELDMEALQKKMDDMNIEDIMKQMETKPINTGTLDN